MSDASDSYTTNELAVVMPVYNEQSAVELVVDEWVAELRRLEIKFTFLIIDDGSQDATPEKLVDLQNRYGKELKIYTQANAGHGQACIQGYRIACQLQVPYIFQIDSDGQCAPKYFEKIWKQREDFDVIYGYRVSRDDGFMRIVVSRVLRAVVFFKTGVSCVDPNSPYRLMKMKHIVSKLPFIDGTFHLANVALAVLLRKDKSISHGVEKIGFRQRIGGEKGSSPFFFLKNFWRLNRDLNHLKKGLIEMQSVVSQIDLANAPIKSEKAELINQD